MKFYDFDGRLEFEGEYLNGKRWIGKEKEYNSDDELIFEGYYFNGERKGKRRKKEEYYDKLGYLNK